MRITTDLDTISDIDKFISQVQDFELIIIITRLNQYLADNLYEVLTRTNVIKLELTNLYPISITESPYYVYAPEIEAVKCRLDNFEFMGDNIHIGDSTVNNSSLIFNDTIVADNIKSMNCKFRSNDIDFILSSTSNSKMTANNATIDYSIITNSNIKTENLKLLYSNLSNAGNGITRVHTSTVEEYESAIECPIFNHYGRMLEF